MTTIWVLQSELKYDIKESYVRCEHPIVLGAYRSYEDVKAASYFYFRRFLKMFENQDLRIKLDVNWGFGPSGEVLERFLNKLGFQTESKPSNWGPEITKCIVPIGLSEKLTEHQLESLIIRSSPKLYQFDEIELT